MVIQLGDIYIKYPFSESFFMIYYYCNNIKYNASQQRISISMMHSTVCPYLFY